MNSDNATPSNRVRPTKKPRKIAPATPSPDPNPFLEATPPFPPQQGAPQGDPAPAAHPPIRSPKQENP